MTTTKSTHEKAYQKYAWVILFVTGILLALGAVFLIAASGPDMFEVDTGVAWAEFSDAYPTVATAYQLEQRLAYISGLGLALFALVITLVGFRQRHRWAWYALGWCRTCCCAAAGKPGQTDRRPSSRRSWIGCGTVKDSISMPGDNKLLVGGCHD